MTYLDTLQINDNYINSINLSGLVNLSELDIASNKILSLDISTNIHLEYIYADDNLISNFIIGDMNAYQDMSELEIDYNGLCNVTDSNTLSFFDEYTYSNPSWKDYQLFCPVRNLATNPTNGAVTLSRNSPKQNGMSDENSTNVRAYIISSDPNSDDDDIVIYVGPYDSEEEQYMYWENTQHSWSQSMTGLTNGTPYTFTICAIHANEGPDKHICTDIVATPGATNSHSNGGGG